MTLPRAAPTCENESFGYPTLTCLIHTRSDITSGTLMSESNLPDRVKEICVTIAVDLFKGL